MGLEGAISDTGSINNGTVSTTDSVLDSELRDSISADQWIAGSINNSTVSTAVGGRRRVPLSRSSSLLASIPICTTQKCLIKYGCSHC